MRGVLERKRGPPRSSSRGTLATISFASLSVLLSLPYLSLTSSRACRARELLLRGAPFVSQGIRKEAKKQAEAYARERVEELRTNVARESGRVAMDKVFFFFPFFSFASLSLTLKRQSPRFFLSPFSPPFPSSLGSFFLNFTNVFSREAALPRRKINQSLRSPKRRG